MNCLRARVPGVAVFGICASDGLCRCIFAYPPPALGRYYHALDSQAPGKLQRTGAAVMVWKGLDHSCLTEQLVVQASAMILLAQPFVEETRRRRIFSRLLLRLYSTIGEWNACPLGNIRTHPSFFASLMV